MAMAGVPMAVIARLLGHTDSRTTERVYAKHTPDYLRRAVAALSA
jgi:integrase